MGFWGSGLFGIIWGREGLMPKILKVLKALENEGLLPLAPGRAGAICRILTLSTEAADVEG